MKTRASILRSAPGQYETAVLDLEQPQAGEILVRLAAAGLCHSDDHIAVGDTPIPVYPIAGGHEGAGIVQEVGAGVRGIRAGDHVVFSFLPACGRCRWCARGQQNLCDLGANVLVGSRFDDPTSFRMSLDGAPVAQMAGLATFAEYTTVDANSCLKIDDDIPLDSASLLGCSVGTGWGAAVYSAGVTVGDSVIVMGVGGIGMNAVQGAAHAGASHILAVDPVSFKRDTALKLGATDAYDTIGEATERAQSLTNGQGADAVIVAIGVTTGEHVAQAFAATRKGGTIVVSGLNKLRESGAEAGIPISLGELALYQKRIQGSLYGACSPTADIPRQIELYRRGVLKLDELITTRYSLDQVAEGYRDMHAGRNIRGVIVYD